MSRPKYYWNGLVKTMIKGYPYNDNMTKQERTFKNAIDKALTDVQKLENGDNRVVAIDLLYFQKTHTLDGVAIQLNYSKPTVQRWVNDFVNRVGKNAGF